MSELVDQGLLQPPARDIFRLENGRQLRLHRHQKEAVEAARTGKSYVLTTGTGSGKSLAYIIPIVDDVLRAKADGSYRPGIKAIVVYPMNALANSQLGELEKFLGTENQPVTFERYTGQESTEKRKAIIANPPDILLTNYVMLELVLTRPHERGLVRAAKGLLFLVLDELHTYRGRQGADVALLVRRLRDACDAPDVQCIGTSATMTTEGGPEEQKREVARVASTLFGTAVDPERVIGETLERITHPAQGNIGNVEALRQRIADPTPPDDFAGFATDSLASWIEEVFGFEPDSSADSPRRRRRPPTIPEAATLLAAHTGEDQTACATAITETLQAGARIVNPTTGRPIFAFRLHQFLSKGDNVYVTLEPPGRRHVTSTYQVAAPGTTPDSPDRILVPTSFCRECGQEYLSVTKIEDGGVRYIPRRDNDAGGGNDNAGYLVHRHRLPDHAHPAPGPRPPPSRTLTQMLTPGTVTDLTGFLRADQICTPIATAVTVDLTEPPQKAHDRLKLARFDQAPVMRAGRPVGWVTTESLARRKSVKSSLTALEDCILVSAESSIAGIVPLLADNNFLFVVGAGDVLGFSVRSDLDRHAVRSYFYLLVARIEMQLSEIVKNSCKPDVIADKIDGRLKKAFAEARNEGQETSPVEYLYLKTLIKLFKGVDYDEPALWNEELSGLLNKIESFRNNIMHPNRSLAASANTASIGRLPSWATEVSDALSRIIAFSVPST